MYLKEFQISKRKTPSIHPNCQYGTGLYSERKEYEYWLDFISNGGTTEEWEKVSGKGYVIINGKPQYAELHGMKLMGKYTK